MALGLLARLEPPDSRAVSNEFVAMATVLVGIDTEESWRVIDDALAALSHPRKQEDGFVGEVNLWVGLYRAMLAAAPPAATAPSKEWCLNMAEREGDAEIGAGLLAADPVPCSDCPPVGYPTDETRCAPCPRRAAATAPQGEGQPMSEADAISEAAMAMRDRGIDISLPWKIGRAHV